MDAVKQLVALLKEADACVYWVPPDMEGRRRHIGALAYKCRDLERELAKEREAHEKLRLLVGDMDGR
jgi:hypothetical protein